MLTNGFFWKSQQPCLNFFKIFGSLVLLVQNKPSTSPWRRQGGIPRRTISYRKAFVCPQKGNWVFFLTFPLHWGLFSVYFQTWNAKVWSWKPPHGKSTPVILLKMFVTFPTTVSNCMFPFPLKTTKHMLTRQILIGQWCWKPFETIGTKLSSWGGGDSYLLRATLKERTDVRT